MSASLSQSNILVTGITDANSLALRIALRLKSDGAKLACTGLGKTGHHQGLSEKAAGFLDKTYAAFEEVVRGELGADIPTAPLDATVDPSIADAARTFQQAGLKFNGVLHSIAMDKTIRGGVAKPMMEVTREEFLGALDVSAYSLLALVRELLAADALADGASVIALSYIGGERVMDHPYRNIGVAKSALERLAIEMSFELGRSRGIRVNVVRFSPYGESKAGGAIEGMNEAVASQNERSPLGNARAEDLAAEIAHLFQPDLRVSGEVRHVDGGFHIRG